MHVVIILYAGDESLFHFNSNNIKLGLYMQKTFVVLQKSKYCECSASKNKNCRTNVIFY